MVNILEFLGFRSAVLVIALMGGVMFRYFHYQAAKTGRTMLWSHADNASTRIARVFGFLVIGDFMWGGTPYLAWSYCFLPEWVRWSGVALSLLCIPAFYNIFSTRQSSRITSPDSLVTEGLYSVVRHPFYAVGFLWFFAVGVAMSSWLVMLASIVVLAINIRKIPQEEATLLILHGDNYRRYKERTGMLFPRRLGSKNSA